jgi:ATP-dependent Clp protease ATP-binding subunit ClpA
MNVVLILTSNAGSREMSAKGIGFGEGISGDAGDDAIRRASASKAKLAIERVFSPEFRNRLDAIVTFSALTPAAIERIVKKFVAAEASSPERHIAIAPRRSRAWLAKATIRVRRAAARAWCRGSARSAHR